MYIVNTPKKLKGHNRLELWPLNLCTLDQSRFFGSS